MTSKRTETVSVRLDPKLRYLAELAARKQRRSLSSFIEWAIEESLGEVVIDEKYSSDGEPRPVTLKEVGNELYDVEESDRFAKLALRYPTMLDHIQQVIWKLTRENGWFWKGYFNKNDDRVWSITADSLCFDRLQEYWRILNEVAGGNVDKGALPDFTRKRPKPVAPKGDPMPPIPDDEDIPF